MEKEKVFLHSFLEQLRNAELPFSPSSTMHSKKFILKEIS